MQEIITKADARSRGLALYFTGKPCTHGHISQRYLNSGDCVACALVRSQIQRGQKPTPHPISSPREAQKEVNARRLELQRRVALAPPDELQRRANVGDILDGTHGRPRTVSKPSSIFSAEHLEMADLWSRRIIGDITNQRQGLRSMYPSPDEWTACYGEEAALKCPHVSGKALGDCTPLDLVIASLAYRMAMEHLAERECAA